MLIGGEDPFATKTLKPKDTHKKTASYCYEAVSFKTPNLKIIYLKSIYLKSIYLKDYGLS